MRTDQQNGFTIKSKGLSHGAWAMAMGGGRGARGPPRRAGRGVCVLSCGPEVQVEKYFSCTGESYPGRYPL